MGGTTCNGGGAMGVGARRQAPALRFLRGAHWLLAVAGVLFATQAARAVDPTWTVAVEVSATVPDSPPWTITLTWPEDTYAGNGYAPSYTLFRKRPEDTEWGEGKSLGAGQTSYVDEDVIEGERYEYRIVREFRNPRIPQWDHDGYGYILAGINVPLVHHRGKVILVVEHGVAEHLAGKVERLRRDLAGDGWDVKQIDVSIHDSPQHVQQLIRDEYHLSEARPSTVFLLGRVPIAMSGHIAPDFHERRALPADAFYGDIDGEWKDADGNGIFEEDTIPTDVELQVGRVDFAEMDGAQTEKSELELIERYLDKDHAFRHAVVRPPRRALIGDRVGMDRGRAPSASGYRAFATFFGPENVFRADTELHARDEERWLPMITAEPYLWVFGSGGGDFSKISFLGMRDEYRWAHASDVAAGAKGTFYLFFGSYFLDWAKPNNLMRAALAAPEFGLTAMWCGRPSLYFHHMGLGETIGYGVRLSQNNDGFYYSPGFPNSWRRHVHVALMGDPTLRLDYVAPAAELSGERSGTTAKLAWKPSPDAEAEPVRYHVYRAAAAEGPFVQLTADSIAELEFADGESFDGAVYMVRAVKLQRTSSGTYFNASQGVFWQ